MIDLCIISYNTKDKLKRLIDTLSSDYKSDMFNLYILDNNSQDGSQEYLTEVVEPMGWSGEIILSSFNYGYSFGCNLLASRGRANVIGLLNADVWLYTDQSSVMRWVGLRMPGYLGLTLNRSIGAGRLKIRKIGFSGIHLMP